MIRLSDVVVELKEAQTQDKNGREAAFWRNQESFQSGEWYTFTAGSRGVLQWRLFAAHVLTNPVGEGWPTSPITAELMIKLFLHSDKRSEHL